MILVTGATGRIGAFLVRALTAAGAGVRALVHERTAGLDPACERAYGDLDVPASLDAVFAGVERVFLLCKERARSPAQERNALEAAQRAGVKHVVKLSAWGADQADFPLPVVRRHAQGEAMLMASGLAYTILRPNYFMQNLSAHLHQIRAGYLRAAMGDASISMIDARDIADAAARVLLEDGHAGRAYTLTGSAALGFGDVAEVLARVLGRPVVYQDITPGDARRELCALGIPEARVEDILAVYAAYRSGVGAAVTDDAARLLGRAPRTFEQFAQAWAPHA